MKITLSGPCPTIALLVGRKNEKSVCWLSAGLPVSILPNALRVWLVDGWGMK